MDSINLMTLVMGGIGLALILLVAQCQMNNTDLQVKCIQAGGSVIQTGQNFQCIAKGMTHVRP